MASTSDILARLGPLGFATRLWRLADEIFEEVNDVYLRLDFDLNSRFFTLLYLISYSDGITVTEAAKQLGLTHPAVSQMASFLRTKGLITDSTDAADERRRLMRLTEQGERLRTELIPVWETIEREVEELIAASRVDLLGGIERVEKELHEHKFSQRVMQRMRGLSSDNISISLWQKDLKPFFHDLNREWIDRFFGSEEKDLAMLKDPEQFILANGGMVFFALVEGKTVGTGALIKQAPTHYEVVKMGVSRAYRGCGTGHKLLTFMINWARQQGAQLLSLETNSQLVGAIKLYKRLGFIEKPHPKGKSDYVRADVYMDLSC